MVPLFYLLLFLPILPQDSVQRLLLASFHSYFLGDLIQFHAFQYIPRLTAPSFIFLASTSPVKLSPLDPTSSSTLSLGDLTHVSFTGLRVGLRPQPSPKLASSAHPQTGTSVFSVAPLSHTPIVLLGSPAVPSSDCGLRLTALQPCPCQSSCPPIST